MTSNSETTPATTNLGDDRRKHLDFIQTAIARMSTASGTAKGWSLTVTTVALGYSLTKNVPSVALLGIAAVLMFGYMDLRYLREERKFRALYEDARTGGVDVYDMRTNAYADRCHAKYDSRCDWTSISKSWSQWGFYGPVVLGGLAIMIYDYVR